MNNYKKIASIIINVNKYLSHIKLNNENIYIQIVSKEKIESNWNFLDETQKSTCRELFNYISSNHFDMKTVCLYAIKYYYTKAEYWNFKTINKIILNDLENIFIEFKKENYLLSIKKFEKIIEKSGTSYNQIFSINEKGNSFLYELFNEKYIDFVLLANIGEIFNDFVIKNKFKNENEEHKDFRKVLFISNLILKGV